MLLVVHGFAAPLELAGNWAGSVARISASWFRRPGLEVRGGGVRKSGT